MKILRVLLTTLALTCAQANAIQLNKAAEALLNEAQLLLAQGKQQEAFNKYADAAKADPASSLPLSSMANMLGDSARKNEGGNAAQVDPKYSTAWIYAGDCFLFQQKWTEAEARFRKGVEAEPLNAQGWRFLADALIHQDKRDAAQAALISGIAAQPSQLPNWERLAQLRGARGFPLTRLQLAPKASGQAGDKSFANSSIPTACGPDQPSVWIAHRPGRLRQ